jgi:hypothetical protein
MSFATVVRPHSSAAYGGKSFEALWFASVVHQMDPAALSWSLPICGGAVIAPGWLLTAAHPGVQARSHAIRRSLTGTGPVSPVTEVHVHPRFNCGGQADIGLLRFDPDELATGKWGLASAADASVVARHQDHLERVELRPRLGCPECLQQLGHPAHCGPGVVCGRTLHPVSGGPAQLHDRDSGSPLVQRSAWNEWRVTGVLSRASTRPGHEVALATRITPEIFAWMTAVMAGGIPQNPIAPCP